VLFLVGDFFAQQLFRGARPELAGRFHYLEAPRSPAADRLLGLRAAKSTTPEGGEVAVDVRPVGGTLVLFDSVALPHEVLPTKERERWAVSGWFHEKQQGEHHTRA
jgi:hypothetical protein